jgi:hypothetical protein
LSVRLLAAGRLVMGPAAESTGGRDARPGPASRLRLRQRSGPFDSTVNLLRMTLAIVGGMVLGTFICAALGY